MDLNENICPICQANTKPSIEIPGRIPPFKNFSLHHCQNCHFSFIPNPRTDFENIYNEEYYKGNGADPWINYTFDSENPNLTIRNYEWQGLVKIFEQLRPKTSETAKWLDYGGGLGDLVRYGRDRGIDISGYDPYGRDGHEKTSADSGQNARGADQALASSTNSPMLSAESLPKGVWDYVTAIEVIEHISDPLTFLSDIRELMKDGGVLFLTTGNAKPFRRKMSRWSYASCPDIHVSFFEPETLAMAFAKTGFKPIFPGFIPGFTEVVKYKILKNLRFKRRSPFFEVMPWPLVSRLADAVYHVTAMPIAVAI